MTSCSDYDADIDSLNSKVENLSGVKNDLAKAVAELNTSIASAKASAAAAQATADAAKIAAQQGGSVAAVVTAASDAADAAAKAATAAAIADGKAVDAKVVADAAMDAANAAAQAAATAAAGTTAEDAAKAAQASADKAQAAADAAMKKATELEAELVLLKARILELEGAENASKEDLDMLAADIDAFTLSVQSLLGNRITSISLVPKLHINGIPAILFESIEFDGQRFNKDHRKYGFTTNNIVNDFFIIDSKNTIVDYRLSPRYVKSDALGVPFYDAWVAENIITYSVDADKAGRNMPISPVAGQTLNISDEGILHLKVTKTVGDLVNHEYLDWNAGASTRVAGPNGYWWGWKEKFYYASLGIPIAEKDFTEDEIEKGVNPIVTSEPYRIAEVTSRPRIKSLLADEKIVAYYDTDGTMHQGDDHYYPYSLDKDGKPVHYSDSTMLYQSNIDENIDVYVDWAEKVDLHTLVTVGSEWDHSTIENFKEYGLEFRFAVANAKYLKGPNNQTDEQQFATVDANGHLTSRTYDITTPNITAVGREPIIRVSLINTNKNNRLVDQRYMKVQWIKPLKITTLPAFTFEPQIVSCEDIINRIGTKDVNEKIYYAAGMSKKEFNGVFSTTQVVDVMKGSVYLKQNGVWIPGLNDSDVQFNRIIDPLDNESWNYNLVLSPEAVGKIVPKEKETYTVTVKFIDNAVTAHGDIHMDFIVDVVVPTQNFAYQGTYWKDGVGQGVFNVNPMVYNPAAAAHGNPPMVGDSHIQADLVNGYVNTSNVKPSNLAQFIKHIGSCAEVKFIFDNTRFNAYPYLSGYRVSADGISLWKSNVTPPTPADFGYIQPENAGASINNMFGAMASSTNPMLGTGNNEANAIIRLHERDNENATAAAKGLIGKNVPVNLVVAYNVYNVVEVQKFEVHFIDPLKIDGMISGAFTDAVIAGSYVNVETGFTFTDWNSYSVARTTVVNPTEKQKWASQLYLYYAVDNVVFNTAGVRTSLKRVGDTYQHDDGTMDGNLPTNRSLVQVDNANQPVASDPTKLGYYNNDGTPVNVNYSLFVDVSVNYKWGTLNKTALKINVNKAGGTPSN